MFFWAVLCMDVRGSAAHRSVQRYAMLEVVTRVRLWPALKNGVFFRGGSAVHQKGTAVNHGLAAAGVASIWVLFWPVVQENMVQTLLLCCGLVVLFFSPSLTHPRCPCSCWRKEAVHEWARAVSYCEGDGAVRSAWDGPRRPLRSTTEPFPLSWRVDGCLLDGLSSQGPLELCMLSIPTWTTWPWHPHPQHLCCSAVVNHEIKSVDVLWAMSVLFVSRVGHPGLFSL